MTPYPASLRPCAPFGQAPDLMPSLLAAAELVDDLVGQERHVIAAYRWGYRDGYASGQVVGTLRAERELTAVWDAQAAHVAGLRGIPAHAELANRRALPGGSAYYEALLRNGGTEFGGVGRPRVPAPPGAYEQALAWDERRRESAA